VKVASQARAVTSGALHADQDHLAEALEPSQQGAVALRIRREDLHPQEPADTVQRRRHMDVEVCVDTTRDPLWHAHDRHPFSLARQQEWHAPAGTADTTTTGL
jgi:hypothetical protein